MSTLHIEIKLDNAAFEEDPQAVAKLLRLVGSKLERGQQDTWSFVAPASAGNYLPLYDANGNRVGFARVGEEWK